VELRATDERVYQVIKVGKAGALDLKENRMLIGVRHLFL